MGPAWMIWHTHLSRLSKPECWVCIWRYGCIEPREHHKVFCVTDIPIASWAPWKHKQFTINNPKPCTHRKPDAFLSILETSGPMQVPSLGLAVNGKRDTDELVMLLHECTV